MASNTLRFKSLNIDHAARQALLVTPEQWLFIQLRPTIVYNKLNECAPSAIYISEGDWEDDASVVFAKSVNTFFTTKKSSGTKKAHKRYKKQIKLLMKNGFTLASDSMMQLFKSDEGLSGDVVLRHFWGDTSFKNGQLCEVMIDSKNWQVATIVSLLYDRKMIVELNGDLVTLEEKCVRTVID
tara:strand:+ start:2303 stop:2851 length:549 start_codon:yes stop_codon:yes gene_type:complete